MRSRVLYGSIAAGGVLLVAACTGGTGQLTDGLLMWESPSSSSERAGASSTDSAQSSNEGATRSNEPAASSLDVPQGRKVGRGSSASSSSGATQGDDDDQSSSGGLSKSDCAGRYTCNDNKSYTLTRTSKGCNVVELKVTAQDDGTVVDSSGSAVGSWSGSKTSDGKVQVTLTGEGTTITCTRTSSSSTTAPTTTTTASPPGTTTPAPPSTGTGGTPVRDAG